MVKLYVFYLQFCSLEWDFRALMFFMLLFYLKKLSYLYIGATMQLVSTLRIDPEFNLIYFNPNAKVTPL